MEQVNNFSKFGKSFQEDLCHLILNDRTFNDEGTLGHWGVGYDNDNNTNFLINNSYPLPYTVDDTNLIMSVDVNGNQFLRIYEKY